MMVIKIIIPVCVVRKKFVCFGVMWRMRACYNVKWDFIVHKICWRHLYIRMYGFVDAINIIFFIVGILSWQQRKRIISIYSYTHLIIYGNTCFGLMAPHQVAIQECGLPTISPIVHFPTKPNHHYCTAEETEICIYLSLPSTWKPDWWINRFSEK